jgi:starch synthase
MDILLVASEFAPWVCHSEVAEAVASFSKTLKQVGHSVTVFVPYSTAYETGGLLLARRLTLLKINDLDELTVYDTQLPSGVQLVLVGLGANTNGHSTVKAASQFAQAVAALVKERGDLSVQTDIIHVHGWFGGLSALALEKLNGPRPPVVFTIYDINQQEYVSASSNAQIELGPFAGMPQLTLDGKSNILAAALRTANSVTTVSDTYARLLGDAVHSGILASVVHELSSPVVGIMGGIDYARLNPAIDPLLIARFDAEDPSQKGTCKTALQRELGLELDLHCPLLFVPGPLTEVNAGLAVSNSLPALLGQPICLVVAAQSTDDDDIAEAVRQLANQWPKRIALLPINGDRPLHRALSAADFVLFTSQRTALESGHLFAQRYGAVPVASSHGVFGDSLVDCDAKLETGTGFMFNEPTVEELTGAVARAVTVWGQPGFDRLRRRVMRQDLGWERPTRRMLQVYRQVLGIRL